MVLLNADLNAMFGSLINWMLFNLDLACANVPKTSDMAIEEINSVVKELISLQILIPDLLKIKI
jgi:hypothetical protein